MFLLVTQSSIARDCERELMAAPRGPLGSMTGLLSEVGRIWFPCTFPVFFHVLPLYFPWRLAEIKVRERGNSAPTTRSKVASPISGANYKQPGRFLADDLGPSHSWTYIEVLPYDNCVIIGPCIIILEYCIAAPWHW